MLVEFRGRNSVKGGNIVTPRYFFIILLLFLLSDQVVTIRLVTGRDIILRNYYLSDIVREIILLSIRDIISIHDGIARGDYYIIIL